MNKCELCERTVSHIEKHHLFPVKTRRSDDSFIYVCKYCGDMIHQMFSNNELQNTYNTLDSLKIGLSKQINWVKTRPEKNYTIASKKRKK